MMDRRGFVGALLGVPFVGAALAGIVPKSLPKVSVPLEQPFEDYYRCPDCGPVRECPRHYAEAVRARYNGTSVTTTTTKPSTSSTVVYTAAQMRQMHEDGSLSYTQP